MISWLVQKFSDLPALALEKPPPGLLTASEALQFSAFRVEKRRREWLLGRWTAKCLLVQLLNQEAGVTLSPASFSIINDELGAPWIDVRDNLGDYAACLRLSISHSHEKAMCAAGWVENLGVDIEWIEPRPDGFADEFLTPEELICLQGASPDSRSILLTAIWSGKEAALKALKLGLKADTRSASCQIFETAGRPEEWHPFNIRLDALRLGRTGAGDLPELCGWWRVEDGYVCTLAIPPGKSISRLVL